MNDRGPLIVTLEDGTKIFRNGVLNSRGYFEFNIGFYNFGAEFNPTRVNGPQMTPLPL